MKSQMKRIAVVALCSATLTANLTYAWGPKLDKINPTNLITGDKSGQDDSTEEAKPEELSKKEAIEIIDLFGGLVEEINAARDKAVENFNKTLESDLIPTIDKQGEVIINYKEAFREIEKALPKQEKVTKEKTKYIHATGFKSEKSKSGLIQVGNEQSVPTADLAALNYEKIAESAQEEADEYVEKSKDLLTTGELNLENFVKPGVAKFRKGVQNVEDKAATDLGAIDAKKKQATSTIAKLIGMDVASTAFTELIESGDVKAIGKKIKDRLPLTAGLAAGRMIGTIKEYFAIESFEKEYNQAVTDLNIRVGEANANAATYTDLIEKQKAKADRVRKERGISYETIQEGIDARKAQLKDKGAIQDGEPVLPSDLANM